MAGHSFSRCQGGGVVYEALAAGGAVDEGFMSGQEAVTYNPASYETKIVFLLLGFFKVYYFHAIGIFFYQNFFWRTDKQSSGLTFERTSNGVTDKKSSSILIY